MYDQHEIWIAAEAQLEAEGLDVLDLHDPIKSKRICLDLVGLLLRHQANGTLELASVTIRDELRKLHESEVEAIVEEMEAGMRDYGDFCYDQLKEEGFGQ